MFNFVIIFVLVNAALCIDKPRGIPFSKLSFYQPNSPFKCLDGSGMISWSKVNDDYCDCRDATDEPGTSACSNGAFYCDNKGHKPQYILSSRVNDGICDCCDGQDEYLGIINCNNTCWEMGAIAREEVKRLKEAAVKGNKIYQEYIKDYEVSVAEKKSRLEAINEQFKVLNEEKLAAERVKTDAEIIETDSKRVFEENWKKLQLENQTNLELKKILKAFKELDIDSNDKVSFEELLNHHEFDIDQNGEVSIEEAKEYLSEHDTVDETQFTEIVWPNIKQIFKFKDERIERDTQSEDVDTVNEPMDHSSEDEKKLEESTQTTTEKMEYDEETLRIISVADEARKSFEELNDKYTKLDNEKKNIENLLNLDYGTNSAFFKLAEDDMCYELTDREYIYKLCPFKKTSQMSKDSSHETELGRWGHWVNDDQYSTQIYDNGLACWNGPNRQTKVLIKCGIENKLTEASEPSRCEYQFKFETPSACTKSPEQYDEHDEL